MSSDRGQNHFTIAFPIKSPADAKALAEELPPLTPDLFRAEDAIGTVHYSRFTVLSDKTLLFLADFDGDFGALVIELAGRAGPFWAWITELKRLFLTRLRLEMNRLRQRRLTNPAGDRRSKRVIFLAFVLGMRVSQLEAS